MQQCSPKPLNTFYYVDLVELQYPLSTSGNTKLHLTILHSKTYLG